MWCFSAGDYERRLTHCSGRKGIQSRPTIQIFRPQDQGYEANMRFIILMIRRTVHAQHVIQHHNRALTEKSGRMTKKRYIMISQATFKTEALR